jgi:endogenous inhibitor of DNA gyrase (YacG/DUF329 family)
MAPRVVACPQCAAPVEWSPASPFRPFCSQRCRTLDRAAWASGAYRIPTSDDGADAGDDAPASPRDTDP